ncbi:MAG: cbb3-type cytochrome oxidase assembly protein CcoS [Bacteroidia bacterium]|nr:cbb3-type cytochrome oxidase assembly protein CcoS [Bacteroidia bacterium]
MGALVVLILISLVVAVGFLIAFFWSVKTGQMNDDYTPSVRILFENNKKNENNNPLNNQQKL